MGGSRTLASLLRCALLPSVLSLRKGGKSKDEDAPGDTSRCSGSAMLISEARRMMFFPVTVKGVVTAVVPGLSGYYLQDADGGDGNPSTSDGIFVSDRSAAGVRPGQVLQLEAMVSDHFGNRQLLPMENPLLCGESPLPAPVVLEQLPTRGEAPALWDRLQGMLITIASPATVIGLYGMQRFGEVRLATGTGDRLVVPSQVHEPLSQEHDDLLASYRDTLILGSGSSQNNPDPIPFPNDRLTYTKPLRIGDEFLNVTGPLSYRWKKHLVDKVPGLPAPVHVAHNTRPEGPPDVGGLVKIASFNVQNYFNGPPGGLARESFLNRGAQNEFEFTRQRAKIIGAMEKLDAAVFVLSEVENNGVGPGSAVDDLVSGLNAATHAGKFAAPALPNKIGSDVIANNFIFQPALVKVVGTPAILDSSVDRSFIDSKNRPSIAVTFEEVSSGKQITVVANHLKSKGSSCAACCLDFEIEGVGNCNGVRTNATIALGRWLQTHPTGVPVDDVLITGDINAYHAETPIQALIQDFGFVDMVDRFNSKTSAYSFVFNGLSGYLDHALVSASLASKVSGVKDWHINADESRAFEYTTKFKSQRQVRDYYAPGEFRCSDHDPLLIGVF